MKTRETIAADLETLVQGHYYSEDFELLSSFRAYASGLADGEKEILTRVAFERLAGEGSMVNILLCSVVQVPEAVPVLAERLSREPNSNQVTRCLIAALSTYRSDEAYTAVERFLDSDQELEAVQALARIDFVRALPRIVRLMPREHARGMLLHLFHARMKEAGLDRLIGDLRQSSATRSADFRDNMAATLRCKQGGYNPFSEQDIAAMLAGME